MALRHRLVIVGLLALIALGAYALGRFYSPALMTYVVEQTLIEKAPPGTDASLLRHRFEAAIGSQPAGEKLQRLMRLSQYLEKVQELTQPELDLLLRDFLGNSGDFRNQGNFFLVSNV